MNLEKVKKESETILSNLQTAVEQFPVMVDKANRAKMALSAVKTIQNDEDDAKAEKLLVKVKNTHSVITEWRKGTTGPLDNLKKKLMEPEKMISILPADKDSEYNRVKALRDRHANEKFLEQKRKSEEIARQQAEKEEIIRLSAAVEKAVFEGIVDAVYTMDLSVNSYLQDLSLDNFEEKEKRLKITPKLKQTVYDGWFAVDYDSSKVSKEKFDAFVENAKKTLPYEKSNADYIKSASEVLKSFVDKLPERKKELEKLAELEKSNKAEAEKQKAAEKERAEKERAEKERKLAEEKEAKQAEIDLKARNEKVEASFDAQVSLQNQEDLKNVRTTKRAVVDCKPSEIAAVFAKVLFACFSSPNFKGYLKKDKDGKVLPADENGIPQYEAWADTLLKFYAENSDMKIEGITIKETVSTIQKKK